jgi:hypothetical protein
MSENLWPSSFPEYLDLDFVGNESALFGYDSTLAEYQRTSTLHSSARTEAIPDRQDPDVSHNVKAAIPRNVLTNTITSSGRVSKACESAANKKPNAVAIAQHANGAKMRAFIVFTATVKAQECRSGYYHHPTSNFC